MPVEEVGVLGYKVYTCYVKYLILSMFIDLIHITPIIAQHRQKSST